MLPIEFADQPGSSERRDALQQLMQSPMLQVARVSSVTARQWWPPHGIPPASRREAQRAVARQQALVALAD